MHGQFAEARCLYQTIESFSTDSPLQALIRNDLAVLAAVEGDSVAARQGLAAALALDEHCSLARDNLALLQEDEVEEHAEPPAPEARPRVGPRANSAGQACTAADIRVALVSFLFNWPSTGGGIVHTVELAQFLGKAGYEVRHFYAGHRPWGVGCVERSLPYPSEALPFDESTWNVPSIQARYRQAIEQIDPDYVILTDSWNMKPLLAEAVSGYPFVLRLQAMECLCPLNNVRLLPASDGRFRQCPLHQLANPQDCARCVQERGRFSGGLHQAERALCGVGTPAYHERLLWALREAEAVLVVNPLTEALVRPYARTVRVVTAGMDPARFPWPWPEAANPSPPTPLPQGARGVTLFFAGLVEEAMKGFHVLHEACALLWQRRQDFELVATGDPPGPVDACTRFVGWLSQEELPQHLRAADVVVLPTVAQEDLGRTAVEAMAVGRPVLASRLGGLPFTVLDGVTGLLCAPGDPADLARKIERLLDDPSLRERLGQAGRRRFEEHYSWDVIIERHYRPLLCRKRSRAAGYP
jgi:glycosyltransferase involved in cell wall biosynthesis